MRFHSLAATGLTALMLVSAGYGTAMAQERMRPVGSVTYDPQPAQQQRGVFQIRPEERRIRSMRVLAEQGSAEVRSLTVNYTDGSSETVPVRQTLRAGERSALFELEEVRPIRSVQVSYVPRGSVTLVLLADPRRGEPTPPPPRPARWVELGCENVSFTGDRDTITVGTSQRFRAVRLRSLNFEIEVNQMTVRFGNGARETYPLRQIIPANSGIGPIDLRGEARRISAIELDYRARTLSPIKTRLCIEGQEVDLRDED
jgi:hypothetical protein